LTDLDEAALAGAKKELQGITQVEVFAFDVRDREAYARAAEEAERVLGPVTLLFNNAGIAGGDSVRNLSYSLWDWYLGINLYGVVNGIQTFLPKMIATSQGGHIVNTSSGAGLAATGAGLYYTTSKFAVVGMSEELNLELKSTGIGVSVLCPALVATNILKRSTEAAPKAETPLPAEVEKRIAEAVMQSNQRLLQQGVGIDDVGEMVLKGVRENALYIFTDRVMEEPIKSRTKALLEALP